MFNLIDTAYAAAAEGQTGGGLGSTILMIVVMIAIFYFLLIRPQRSEEGRLADHDRRRVWPCRDHHRPHRGY